MNQMLLTNAYDRGKQITERKTCKTLKGKKTYGKFILNEIKTVCIFLLYKMYTAP